MAFLGLEVWQWLALIQYELLLFAGIFFLIGAADDLTVDLVWIWLRLTGKSRTPIVDRAKLHMRPLHAKAAVLVPTWQEASVVGHTIRQLLESWPQSQMQLYVGCYRNDPQTINAVMAASGGDSRLRIVIHDREGPTTKADCLNRLYEAMRDDERRSGVKFAMAVFHDAEDSVDPAGLGLLDAVIEEGADFAQLPVEPLPQSGRQWLGSHYCEEFAEAHGKAMVVRNALGAGIPGAGVGCAVSRAALKMLCRQRRDGAPFAAESLTEDYEMGLTIHQAGGKCHFARARGTDGLLVATRAYFPNRLDHIVTQKTRWVHGIALQGWDRIGWSGGIRERWMRARDRRGPMTALVLLLGYSLIVLTALSWTATGLGFGDPVELSPMLKALLVANFVMFGWRAAFRFAFTAREYGFWEGIWSVLRIPATNVISIIAGRRATTAYARTLLGDAVVWDKTPHKEHPAKVNSAATGAQ